MGLGYSAMAFSLVLATLLAICSLRPKYDLVPVASDTWDYFKTATYENGLTDDRMVLGDGVELPDRTSPTNIGMYLFSVSCAKRLAIIGEQEARIRVAKTLLTLATLERDKGFYYNWYTASDGKTMSEWVPGRPIPRFLSSVDNAWLAASLIHVEREYPHEAPLASSLLAGMDFGFFYDAPVGLFYGGYDCDQNQFTKFHYGILNSETRLVSYVARKRREIPDSHFTKLTKETRNGSLLSSYGSMFEALGVSLFVPEIESSPRWKECLKEYASKQKGHKVGGFWGTSYSDDARGVYKEYGIPSLARYPAHFEEDGVVTPYASFLAIQVLPEESLENIAKLDEVCRNRFGFFGAYRPETGEKANCILTLEQGMIMMAIADYENKNPSKVVFEGLVTNVFP